MNKFTQLSRSIATTPLLSHNIRSKMRGAHMNPDQTIGHAESNKGGKTNTSLVLNCLTTISGELQRGKLTGH